MRATMMFVVGLFPVFAYGQATPAEESAAPSTRTTNTETRALSGIGVPSFGADRPGLTDPSQVLGVGMVQIETGFELSGSSTETSQERETVLPQVLLRVGVLPRLELRVSASGYSAATSNESGTRTSSKGIADGAVSAKIKVLESDVMNFTIVPILSVPSFDEDFSSGTFDPTVELVFDRGLPLDLEIGVNVNGALPSGDAGRFFEASGGVALGRGVVGDLGAYIELFGTLPVGQGGLDLILNGGLTYVFENRYQIDIAYGESLTVEGDFFFGFGFSSRIMKWYY